MKSLIIRTIVLLCALTSFQARAIDIGGWLINFVAQQSLNNFDTWNSGPTSELDLLSVKVSCLNNSRKTR